MRIGRLLLLPLLLPLLLLPLAGGAAPGRWALPVAAPNDNRAPAGTLRDGVLAVALEAVLAMWHPRGDSLPGLAVEAFGVSGQRPAAPGPLLRVPAGTEIRLSVRNALERDTLTFYVPARVADPARGGALDSVVLHPGDVRELRVIARRPGSYVYYANGRAPLDRALRMRGLLAGALIVDSAGAPSRPRDRAPGRSPDGLQPDDRSHARGAGLDHRRQHARRATRGALARHRARELLRWRGRVRGRRPARGPAHRAA